MKKVIIPIVIVCVVLVILIAVIIGAISIIGNAVNAEKNPITTEQFKSTMKDKGFTIYSAKSQFSEYDYIEDVYIAQKSNYQIEFYELSDSETASMFYNNNKEIFESSKSTVASQSNKDLKNSSKYVLQSNGKYMVVSRIDNTVVYLSVSDTYKDEVKNLLDEIGY